jgi:hypothetical protein
MIESYLFILFDCFEFDGIGHCIRRISVRVIIFMMIPEAQNLQKQSHKSE